MSVVPRALTVLAALVGWVPRVGGGTRGWEMLCGTKLDWDAI